MSDSSGSGAGIRRRLKRFLSWYFYTLFDFPTRRPYPGEDDCACGHDHGVSTTTCDRCHWCQQENRPKKTSKTKEKT